MLVLTSPVNIYYFSGVKLETYERFAALILCKDRAIFVVPKLDEGRVPRPSYTYADGEDPAGALRRAVQDCGGGEIEVDGSTTLRAWEVFRRALGEVKYRIADGYIYERRAVKRPDEVEKIAEAARRIKRVIDEISAELSQGISEREAAARIYLKLVEEGLEPGPILVQFGENTALPHQGPTERKLREGDVVIIDVTAAYMGYYGDITRTFAFRAPPRGFEEVYEAVLEAQRAAISAVRPGRRAGEVDEASRAALRARGLDGYFIHRTGHGLGLEFHEAPNIAPGGNYVLRTGNVFTIEPGVYLPGRFGVRIEDDIVVEESGGRVL
ncbi:MAG: Xaa-Pro peptidase family protein [Thermoproteus sp.]